jgi:hypothetical protein
MAKIPTRITVAFDASTASLLEKMSSETQLSQSEIMRRALRFYGENKILTDSTMLHRVYAYLEMLGDGEHIVLDGDHWLLFLRMIDNSVEQEKFWAEHKKVARAHGEQLKNKVRSAEDLLKRLELCNFYRLTKISDKEYTLIFGSEEPKKFVRLFIEEFFAVMAVRAEIRENLTKLNISIRSEEK